MKTRILVIDDEESIRFTFNIFLAESGYYVSTAESYDAALKLIETAEFDLIFLDIILDRKSGIDILKAAVKLQPITPVIMITGVPSIETATESLRIGALDYIVKPIRQDTLLRVTTVALKHRALAYEKESCRLNFEAIFRSVKDGILTVDETMTITEANLAATRICRYERNELVGKPVQVMAQRCNGHCAQIMQEVLTTKSPLEARFIECNHAKKPTQVISLTASPLLGKQNEFTGAVMVIRDETRLHMLEREAEDRREFDRIVGKSKVIREVKTLIRDLADVQTTVLVTGESGTGKDMVVEALHHIGNRRNKPLVKVNCTALSEQLLESELFGHARGAFTGAVKDRVGRFEHADGGIIFLDEIGDISPCMQSRLLHVIESREFERVGESIPMKVDVRVVAATNSNLPEKVASGKFREDLYYRLKVIEICLPPLRERRSDIPLLLEYFLNSFNRRFDKSIRGITTDAYKVLMDHDWPGNVRELENTLEQAFVRCQQGVITIDHLPPGMRDGQKSLHTDPAYDDKHDEVRRIRRALKKTYWNKSKAAELLGISRRTLYRKIAKHDIAMDV